MRMADLCYRWASMVAWSWVASLESASNTRHTHHLPTIEFIVKYLCLAAHSRANNMEMPAESDIRHIPVVK